MYNRLVMDLLTNAMTQMLPHHTRKIIGKDFDATEINEWAGTVCFACYSPLEPNPDSVEIPCVYNIRVREFFGDYTLYAREVNDNSPNGMRVIPFVTPQNELDETVIKIFGNGWFAKTREDAERWTQIVRNNAMDMNELLPY